MRPQSSHPLAKRQRPRRFAYYLHLTLPVRRLVFIQMSDFIHISVLLLHIRSRFLILCILFLLLLHPPSPGLCGLRKWSELVVITTLLSNTVVMFRRWIKGPWGSPRLLISFSHPRPANMSLSSPIVSLNTLHSYWIRL